MAGAAFFIQITAPGRKDGIPQSRPRDAKPVPIRKDALDIPPTSLSKKGGAPQGRRDRSPTRCAGAFGPGRRQACSPLWLQTCPRHVCSRVAPFFQRGLGHGVPATVGVDALISPKCYGLYLVRRFGSMRASTPTAQGQGSRRIVGADALISPRGTMEYFQQTVRRNRMNQQICRTVSIQFLFDLHGRLLPSLTRSTWYRP